jgi:hypothetical protein
MEALKYELVESAHKFADGQGLWLRMLSPALKDKSQPIYMEPVAPGLKSAIAALRWQIRNIDGTWPTVDFCNAHPEIPEGTIRHGDVVLQKIEKMPTKGLKRILGASLAMGTSTGSRHVLTVPANAVRYELPGDVGSLLVVRKAVGLKHSDPHGHNNIRFAVGHYRVSTKRQYDAALGQRPVVD